MKVKHMKAIQNYLTFIESTTLLTSQTKYLTINCGEPLENLQYAEWCCDKNKIIGVGYRK